MIVSPVPTGMQIEFPFYPGHIYAALKPLETDKVNINNCFLQLFTILVFQMSTVTVYTARPKELIYHDHEYQVMDFKVC